MANKVKIFSTKYDPKGLEGDVNRWIEENKDKNIISVTPSPSGDSQSGFVYSITIFYSSESESERTSERIKVSTVVDFIVGGRLYSEFVEDVSEQGVLIRTTGPFEVGQEIVMTFLLSALERPFKVTGEIVRSMPDGIGVQFKRGTQVQEDMYRAFIQKITGQAEQEHGE